MDDPKTGVEAAIVAAGGVSALAAAIGISHVSVIRWRARGVIPAERVAAVAAATGLPRQALRPDLFAASGLAEAQAPLAPPAQEAETAAAREAAGWERARRWAEENREAIEAYNRHFEENDTPLAEYRAF
ncbi:type II toxin-antitoxin system CcdA family antitoxin [Paracraurococcus lichenis]|uniref:Type II toxin-antitoxin system CcdA family antitoxin n=1 Tax=Paracraurococcus lichenis TaxID=3064888 RepID=A0ABT9DXT5_9PROT|nr:YdaS family helix-turn-helix protein [Paracraurococcus sp. LOR1-02]MDO9708715.1 type II toxin-antitoxin system CcdA family antitoxin [Paracraurococcus sp. LOR1-02]